VTATPTRPERGVVLSAAAFQAERRISQIRNFKGA